MNADRPPFEIDWTPLNVRGANFATCNLKRVSDVRLDFTPTPSFMVFSSFFLVAGLFAVIRVLFWPLKGEGFYVALTIGSLFMLSGGYLLFVHRNRVIFENRNGSWRISKSNVFSKRVTFLPQKTFYAVQVLEKSGESITYELNIIYEDGLRENILSNDNRDLVIKSATTLAEAIKIPLLNSVKVGKPFSKWGEIGPFK